MTTLFEMFGAAALVTFSLMSVLWVVYYFKRNAGIVDIGWAASFFLIAWIYCVIGEGAVSKRWFLTAMVTIWSVRLAWHLWERYRKTEEDPRYVQIRENLGAENSDFKFYLMFLFQGLLVLVLSIPFLIVDLNATPIWSPIEGVGLSLFAIGLVGEALADKQLVDFKSNPENKGKVCRHGLWYFSRHPNYFFEFLIWCGFFLFALGTSWGWISILSPLLILLLLTQVSGIPMTEAQSLKSKGDEYKEYQRTTSPFIPWFPSS